MQKLKSTDKINKFLIPRIKIFKKNTSIRLRPKAKSVLKEKRKKVIRLRKNFLPTLILTILLWSSVVFIIFFIDPDNTFAIPLLLLILFFALLFTFSTIFANTRRGLTISLLIILFLVLRYFGVGNILNFLLILGLGIVVEIYFFKK